MKKTVKTMITGMLVVAISMISFNVCAMSDLCQNDDIIYFTQTDADGNDIKTIPLKKTEHGWDAYRQSVLEENISTAALTTWDLSSDTYTYTTRRAFAVYRLPYQFTGNEGNKVYVNANMTVEGGTWAEIAINNVTSGTTYVGSLELDQSGDVFSASGYLNNILSNNYYTYTLQASTNCSYAEVELYAKNR